MMADKEEKKVEQAAKQVEEKVDEETARGFRGTEVDQTPNEHYTVEGVLANKPVPETAPDPVAARREASGSTR